VERRVRVLAVSEASLINITIQTTRLTRTARWVTAAAVGVPYAVSLCLPAWTGTIDGPNTTVPGLLALLLGWTVTPLTWLANVLLLIGVMQFREGRLRSAAIFGAAVAGCASQLLVWPPGGDNVLEVGYYVWLSSMVIFFVGSSLAWRLRRLLSESRYPSQSAG
jgi:hypothetical protein